MLNRTILPLCGKFFSHRAKVSRPPVFRSESVQQALAAMKRQLDAHRSPGRGRFQAWQGWAAFRASHKHLRKACLQARDLIDKAAHAASRDQMSEVLRVMHQLAPRQRRETVSVRSEDGLFLDEQAQFDSILTYFTQASSSDDLYQRDDTYVAPELTSSELTDAIAQLKPCKSVPRGSLPAEVWHALPDAFASSLCSTYSQGVQQQPPVLPSEITHCSPALLPKPHKKSRLPKDLRPLGVQDPASKAVAIALRSRLTPEVSHILDAMPQFTYCKGKSIDVAICRIMEHCRAVRQRLKEGVVSVHNKRAGATASVCYGGIMVGLDLSRAFDCLTRTTLLRSLQFAGVFKESQCILLEIHQQCHYEITHMRRNGTFQLGRGVRQGCAVSPMLYSLFTVWLLAELGEETDPVWVSQMVTCFADDSHLAWTIEQLSDLDFVGRSLRAVFRLLRSSGMTVNADKSSLVLCLRGSSARSLD